MAITTLDGLIAGLQQPSPFLKVGAATTAGRWYSPFYVAGLPGAATAPTPGVAGAALTSYTGQLPFTNPVSGASYLARFSAACSATGRLRICDRLWHNSGISPTTTTAQTINSVAWPARDRNASTNGVDVFIGVEVSTVMGAGTPTMTMSYTNAAGTAGQTSIGVVAPTTMAVGSFLELPLAAGDTGVRSIQTFTANATMTSGAYSLVAYRILAEIDITVANVGAVQDSLGTGLPDLWNNTVPFLLWLPTSTTAPTFTGSYNVAQG